MGSTLAELADLAGCELRGGDPELEITAAATLAGAGPQQVSFLANTRYRNELSATRAGAVVLSAEDAEHCPVPVLVHANPYAAFARIAQRLTPAPAAQPGIHPQSVVATTAQVDAGAEVGPFCVVDDEAVVEAGAVIGAGSFIGRGAVIGAGTRLVARVTVMHGCRVGARGILHPGVVIGADGFGIANEDGRWIKVPQTGGVRIGDDCEVGANTTIDRGALEDTVIGDGVKLDDQVMVAHNVHIGAHTVVAGCVGIAGSTHIGQRVMIAGACGISGHLNICDDAVIMAMSMVTSDIRQPGEYASGLPLDTLANWKRNGARFRQLDDMAKRLKAIEKKLKE